MIPWKHQARCVSEVIALLSAGHRRICATSPTGGGKTYMICQIIQWAIENGWHVVLYSNRKLLIRQLIGVLDSHGIKHGVRASGHLDQREFPVQISSIPTESKRVLKNKVWQIHGHGQKTLAIVDEAHLNASWTAQELLGQHIDHDGAYVGFTATPIDIGHLYDDLVIAGNMSELFDCGALVPAKYYGPDEPDTRKIRKSYVEYSENDVRKLVMISGIFGRVYDWWKKLNPDARPGILFAPGVKESIWFCEQFALKGVRCAHIDGTDCWLDGKLFKGSETARQDILDQSKDGSIKLVSNRFVLREGIDAPWLYHGILATIFSKLQSYLQSVGRLLRAHPSMRSCLIQDHGGNWWRHGSPNVNREWNLNVTEKRLCAEREEKFREKEEREPSCCPQCKQILMGNNCPCGFTVTTKTRPVAQEDGTLKDMKGDIFNRRRICQAPNGQTLWESMYFRSIKSGKTFRAAAALFAKENNWTWPDKHWPFMPTDLADWFSKVRDVPRERLVQKEQVAHR